jgi:amino acid transporter
VILHTKSPVPNPLFPLQQAFGPYLSFLAGFIAWMMSVVDIALYPVLFMSYLMQILTKYEFVHHDTYYYLLQFSVIVAVMALNLTGVEIVVSSLCHLTHMPKTERHLIDYYHIIYHHCCTCRPLLCIHIVLILILYFF